MKRLSGILVVLAMLLGGAQGFAQSAGSESISLDDVTNLVYEKQRDAQIASAKLAPIRSRSELDQYLSTHSVSPFNAFSKRSLERFVDSLTFNELGLTSFEVVEIQETLTPREAYAILSLFGVQKSISSLTFELASKEEVELLARSGDVIRDDYPGYKCVGSGNCLRWAGYICIGQHCGWIP